LPIGTVFDFSITGAGHRFLTVTLTQLCLNCHCMLRFHDSMYLWALAALPLLGLLYVYVLAKKRQTARKIGDAELVKALTKSYSPRKALLKFALLLLAFACGVLALANLKKPAGSQNAQLNGIDIMLAVDVSKSMLAQDVKPNRLERARQLLTRLTAKLTGHRIGIVVFAGHAYIQMPLTADNNAARLYLASISTDMVPVQGTVMGEALQMCYNSFNAQEKKYKAVVLLSDGEDHDPSALSMAAAMGEQGIVLHTVGFGSAEGSPIVDPVTNEIKKDKDGNTVVSQLNEPLLREIADKGMGSYQAFTTSEAVAAQLEKQLNSLEKRPVSATMGMAYTYYFPWLLGVALLCLLAEWLVSEKKRNCRTISVAMVALLLLTLPGVVTAQSTRQQMKKANTAYQQKDYSKAADGYKAIVKKKPDYLAAQYNLANALYKAGQQEAALKAYEEALKLATTSQQKAAVYYNQGVAYHLNKQLAEAIRAYQNALRQDPSDQDARLNLQKAMQQQQKEQQQRKGPQPSPPKPKQKEPPPNKQQSKPPPSKLSQKQAEEKLKALLQEEKNLQEKLRKNPVTTLEKQEKDW
jgi:tetratricopeptide (TPR) repeat protein